MKRCKQIQKVIYLDFFEGIRMSWVSCIYIERGVIATKVLLNKCVGEEQSVAQTDAIQHWLLKNAAVRKH